MNALARLIPDFDAPKDTTDPAEPTLLSFVKVVSQPDLGPSLADVEARVRAEARAEAEAECERLRAEDRVRFEEELAENRRNWADTEGARLAERVTEALADLETRIADSAARAIGPFLATPLRTKAVDDLGKTLVALLDAREHPNLQVTGPQDLLERIRTHLGERAASIAFCASASTDVRVTADSTVIETQLRSWLDRLGEAIN